jgi:hypothetical protein
VSNRNCRSLNLSVKKRRPVVKQTCAAGVICCAGRRRAHYIFALGPRSGDGISRGWVQCRHGRGICCSVGNSWARAGIYGAGTRVSGAEGRVPEAGAEVFLLGVKCRHLVGEVLDLLQKCGVVGGWTNASERRLGCHLGGAVRTGGCGVQAALLLTGEYGLHVGG